MVVTFFLAVLANLIGIALLNLGAMALGSDWRFGWHK